MPLSGRGLLCRESIPSALLHFCGKGGLVRDEAAFTSGQGGFSLIDGKQKFPAARPRGSAGPAFRPCGPSSGAGSCRAANKIIRILLSRAVQTTVRWKSRKAGKRALRYIFSCVSRGPSGLDKR